MDINEELKAAGMYTIDQLMGKTPLTTFQGNAQVTDLHTFKNWLNMRTKAMLTMKARMTLDKEDTSDLFEWVLSYCAVLGEVRINLNQAAKNDRAIELAERLQGIGSPLSTSERQEVAKLLQEMYTNG